MTVLTADQLGLGTTSPARQLDAAQPSEEAMALAAAGMSWLLGKRGADPSSAMGGLYAADLVQLGLVVADVVPANETAGQVFGSIAHVQSFCPTANIVGCWGGAVAAADGARVWGGNLVVTCPGNVVNAKLVGLEIDVQPSPGATLSSDTGGLFLNAFGVDGCGPALFLGGQFGGSWTNGIVVGVVKASGCGFSFNWGAPVCTSGINLAGGSFTDAACILGNQHDAPSLRVKQSSVSSPSTDILVVSNAVGTENYLRVTHEGAIVAAPSPSLKLSFWGASPITQPSGASQGAVTNNSGGSGSTIPACGNTKTSDQSNKINDGFTALYTLVNAMRAALVSAGLMKGGA